MLYPWREDLMDRSDETRPQPLTTSNASPLTVDQVKGLLARDEPLTFIDSRNPIAWGSSRVKLPDAVRVPIDEVEQHLPSLPRDRRLVVYCT
jgi:rhodanese-related sulfurtransferase